MIPLGLVGEVFGSGKPRVRNYEACLSHDQSNDCKYVLCRSYESRQTHDLSRNAVSFRDDGRSREISLSRPPRKAYHTRCLLAIYHNRHAKTPFLSLVGLMSSRNAV